jgi:hypothetical protein
MDRAYNQAKALIERTDQGVSVVLRYNPHSLHGYAMTGMQIDWYEQLKGPLEIEQGVPVQVRAEGEYLEGTVPACRLPPAPAAEARRRVRVKAKKKGRCVQRRTWVLAEWVLLFTTLPPALLPTATLAALYRVRWPVELVIKRLKSLLDINRLRAREHSALAALYLHGKRLYAAVLEKRARRRGGEDWKRLDRPRRATPWRVWKRLRQELAIAISGVLTWNLSRWQACVELMQERPRRRQLQTLPHRVNRLIAYCQANGLSNI